MIGRAWCWVFIPAVACAAAPVTAQTGTQTAAQTALVTPAERFRALPGYPFAAHEARVPWGGATVAMRYVDEGPRAGPPVLLLHGQPTWSNAYRKLIPLLAARGYRVIAPDLIGFGRSDKPARMEDYSYALHKTAMAAFVRALDLKNATLVVHDWGGLIGLPTLAAMPDRFARVALLNTSLPDGTDVETARFKAGFDAWINLLRTAPVVEVDKVVANLVAKPLTPAELAGYMAPFPDGSYQSGVRSITALIPRSPDAPGAAENAKVRAFLKGWSKPAMIAFSADSERLHPKQFDLFRGLFPASSLWFADRIPGTAHLLFEDRPERVAALIDAFARGAAPPPDEQAQAAAVVAPALSGAALQASVARYVGFGVHRTGSPGAAATLDWLDDRLKAAGYRTERAPLRFPVADVRAASAIVGGRTIEGLPAWPPRWGQAQGALKPLDQAGPGELAYVELPYAKGASVYDPTYAGIVGRIAASKAAGVIASVDHPTGAPVGLNVLPARDAANWPPTLIVGAAARPALQAAMGRPATMRIEGRTEERDNPNLIAAAGPEGAPALVITTPLNGWYTVGGERGPGVAIALGLAEWVRRAYPDWAVRVAFTAGHELGGQGMRAVLDDPRFAADRVKLWINLGANIAGREMTVADGRIVREDRPAVDRGLVASPDLLGAAAAAFAGQPNYQNPISADGARVPGEVALILRHGQRRVVGLVGYQLLHHTPLDDAESTAPALLEPVAGALARLIEGEMK
jgi:haloalkane dehalogenase